MGYESYLWRMLKPLGVYAQTGYGQGELAAEGAALDAAQQVLRKICDGSNVVSAAAEELSRFEELFPFCQTEARTEDRKLSLEALWRLDDGCITLGKANRMLELLGTDGVVRETGTPLYVTVALQQVQTDLELLVERLRTILRLLPCHLGITVQFAYQCAETKVTVSEDLVSAAARTSAQWAARAGTAGSH